MVGPPQGVGDPTPVWQVFKSVFKNLNSARAASQEMQYLTSLTQIVLEYPQALVATSTFPDLADKGSKRVGIVGIGGLGQMGVRIAKAMGNTVTAISTSPNKEAAAREIGADNFVISTDPASMKAAAGSLDLILNTVSADHDLNTYLPLLAARGVLVQMGVALTPHPVSQFPLMFKKLSIAGSLIGGLPETQDCIDFCHKHDIIPKIKLVNCTELERVYQELKNKNDTIIRYSAVIQNIDVIYSY